MHGERRKLYPLAHNSPLGIRTESPTETQTHGRSASQRRRHIGLIYVTPLEAFASIVPFLKEGLEQGEQCIHVGDDRLVEDIQRALRRRGVDVESALRYRGLRFISEWKHRGKDKSGPDLTADSLDRLRDKCLAQGFKALRLSLQMSWFLHPRIECERVAEYESLLDSTVAGAPLSSICAYDWKRLKPKVCLAAVQTHPHAALDEYALSNPFYRTAPWTHGTNPARFLKFIVGELRELVEMGHQGIVLRNGTCVPIFSQSGILAARQKARQMAAGIGFSALDQVSIATAVSELARYILLYVKQGHIVICAIQRGTQRGLLILARDEGTGAPDTALVTQETYSTRGDLGRGLLGVCRVMDEFDVASAPNQGTIVRVRKWVQ